MIYLLVSVVACEHDYPPCSPATASPWTVEGPTPDPAPRPGPDEDAPTRYSKNADGEVCECGPYELGCVESPEAAERASRPGAYCSFPRDSNDSNTVPYDPDSSGGSQGSGQQYGTCPDGTSYLCEYRINLSGSTTGTYFADVVHRSPREAAAKLYRRLTSRGQSPYRIRCGDYIWELGESSSP
jgi:hypothetical protein